MPPMKKIINKALSGVVKAQEQYEYCSGGCWLWEAPEYLVTTYIAEQISEIEDSNYYVTVEHTVREAMNDAGGLGRGRPRHDLRIDGRFDILLWDELMPSGVVEVKNQVARFSQLQSDVARICGVLAPQHAETIQDGLIVFYTSICAKGDEDGVVRILNERLDHIEEKTSHFVRERCRTFQTSKRSKVRQVEDSAWAAAVFHIRP